MKPARWLFLLFGFPTKRKTEQIAVWRRLEKMGAVQIKTICPSKNSFEKFRRSSRRIDAVTTPIKTKYAPSSNLIALKAAADVARIAESQSAAAQV